MDAVAQKPVEVEGLFDQYFYTPVGKRIARWLSRTSLTPNNVSWLSVAAAAAAAACYFSASLAGALAASGLFILSGLLDSADGHLARATGRTSELGETLDGFCDSLSFGVVYLAGAVLFVLREGGSPAVVAVVGVLAAASHSLQSSLVDFERQLFIHFTTVRGRLLREEPQVLRRERDVARAAGEGWWPQALRGMRLAYCIRQRRYLSSSVALLDLHQRHIAPFPERRDAFASRYQVRMGSMLKAWTVLAPNSHTLAVLACGVAPFVLPSVPVARWGLALVFAFDLALNLALVPLVLVQRRIDLGLARDLLDLTTEGDSLRRRLISE